MFSTSGTVAALAVLMNWSVEMAPEPLQRTPKRGGAKGAGGGAKPHEETPHGKQFPTPLTSEGFAPLLGSALTNSLKESQNFPGDPLGNSFGGSPEKVSKKPSLRGFAPRYVPPPVSSAQPPPHPSPQC